MADEEFDRLISAPAPSSDTPPPLPSRRDYRHATEKRTAWGIIVSAVVLVGAFIGGGVWAWSTYGEQILKAFGREEIVDFEGQGTEPEILVTIEPGDIGEDVARRLAELGVTASFEAVYSLLLLDSSITFEPGTYRLLTEMSGQAAIDALRNPDNRAEYSFTLPEGIRLTKALEIIAESTGVPLEELEAATADPTVYGIDSPFGGMEGYLFPATYTFPWGTDAENMVREMVDQLVVRLEAQGIAEADWHRILTIGSIIEREARVPEDFYRVSRVIANRLASDSPVSRLEMDSTVTYWEETYDTVWTTDEARANADNPYNTYYYQGLPPGPIALVGERALDAALNPAEGPWLFFVTWNFETGETLFSATYSEHEANISLGKECRENPDVADQCRQ